MHALRPDSRARLGPSLVALAVVFAACGSTGAATSHDAAADVADDTPRVGDAGDAAAAPDDASTVGDLDAAPPAPDAVGDSRSGSDQPGETDAPAVGPGLTIVGDTVAWSAGPSGLTLAWRPEARIAGQWHGGGRDGACRAGAATLACPAGAAGEVVVRVTPDTFSLSFEAASSVTLEALALRGPAAVPGARAWLSDGFQSWSQAGMLALGPAPSDAALAAALLARGEAEVMRTGEVFSYGSTLIAGGPQAFLIGALTAERFKPWVRVAADGADGLDVMVGNGGTGERVSLAPGESCAGETFCVALGAAPEELLAAYARRVPSRRALAPRPADAGWNSWYDLWDGVDDAAVRANASLAAAIVGPHRGPAALPLRIVIDDGWQRAWGDWFPNDKFPTGLQGLASDLRAQGFTVGVWLAPLLVSADTALAAEHPDWFVADAVYAHPTDGRMLILDVTHPDARAHLHDTIQRIVSWGFDLLKIDFLFAGTFEGGRHEPVTALQAYHRALATVREAAGDDTLLLAVGAPILPSLPYVDAWRLGADIAFEGLGASWGFVVNQARSIGVRFHWCDITLCDADPLLMRDLDRSEVEAAGWVVALAGGAFFLSDDLRALDPARTSWGIDAERVAFATGGRPAVPLDLVPETAPHRLINPVMEHLSSGTQHVLPHLWRLPDGGRLAFNPGESDLLVGDEIVAPHAARRLGAAAAPAAEGDASWSAIP